MGSISKADAQALFAYEEPTLASAVALFGNNFKNLSSARTETAPLAMPELEVFAGPLVWGVYESSEVRVVWVDNVTTWTDAIPFTTSPLFDDVPTLDSSTQELKQLAAVLNIDGAAGPLESTRFNTLDALLRAQVEMLYAAILKQVFAYTSKAAGFTPLRQLAISDGRRIDADGERLSFSLLMCALRELNKWEGVSQQYSFVFSPHAYGQFVELMTSSGNNTIRFDEVTGREHWHFDGVRVFQSEYLEETGTNKAWGLLYKSPGAVLPEAMQKLLQPSAAQGVTIATTRRGVAVRRGENDTASDRTQTNTEIAACCVAPPRAVVSIEEICSP